MPTSDNCSNKTIYNFNIDLVASFEVLSSTEWNFKESFNPNYFEDISDFINFKIKAIKLYKDELKKLLTQDPLNQ